MLKRVIEALAALWGASTIAVESEYKQSEERAAENPLDIHNPSHLAGHEVSDMNPKLLLALAISVIVGAALMHTSIVAGFNYLKRRTTQIYPAAVDRSLVDQRAKAPPAPRLQQNPPADYQTYLAAQKKILNNYGWVDQKAGLARIPVDRAMEILSHGK
jgi:hypothetical protein